MLPWSVSPVLSMSYVLTPVQRLMKPLAMPGIHNILGSWKVATLFKRARVPIIFEHHPIIFFASSTRCPTDMDLASLTVYVWPGILRHLGFQEGQRTRQHRVFPWQPGTDVTLFGHEVSGVQSACISLCISKSGRQINQLVVRYFRTLRERHGSTVKFSPCLSTWGPNVPQISDLQKPFLSQPSSCEVVPCHDSAVNFMISPLQRTGLYIEK